MIDSKTLDELENLEKEVTKGEWTPYETGAWGDGFAINSGPISSSNDDILTICESRYNLPNHATNGADFIFISKYRNVFPEILRLARIGLNSINKEHK